ncbi:MAG: hypothetical protein ACK45B_08320 [Limisphaerales bacterium]|jgi:hypothetical protein
MKTTLDIPDPIFRQAKALAALRGVSLRQFVTEALQEKTSALPQPQNAPSPPPWMRGFGALADLREESRRIEEQIHEAFEAVDAEDRA